MSVKEIQQAVRRMPAAKRRRLTTWMVTQFPALTVERVVAKAARRAQTGAWYPTRPTGQTCRSARRWRTSSERRSASDSRNRADMPEPRPLVHSEWFDHALAQLAELPGIEEVLSEDLYGLSCYADLVRLVPGCRQLRVFQTKELLRGDGHVVRILITLALRDRGRVVELQHIEAVEAEMGG